MYAFSMQKLHTYSSNMHTYMMVLSTLRARTHVWYACYSYTTSVIRMHFASLEVRARRHLSSAPLTGPQSVIYMLSAWYTV